MAIYETALTLVTIPNFLLALGAYVISSALYQIIYNAYFHPISHFPGPFWAGTSRLWLAYHCYMQTELAACRAAHAKYGPVIRVTPSMLLVSEAKKLPEIYHFKADKTPYYVTGSSGDTESLFNIRSHKEHAKFRRLIAPPYSFTKVSAMEGMMDVRLVDWVDKMNEKFAQTGKDFDFCEWAVFMAYDIISDFGFGAPFGFVEAGEDIGGLIKGFHDGMTAFGLLGRLWPFTERAKETWLGKKMLVASPKDNTGYGVLMRYRDKLLSERIADIETGKTPRLDLLQTFLEARTDDGKPLDTEYVKAEILLVLLAGADTTGTSFQAVLHYLFTHPKCFAKMRAEIDDATAKGLLSSPVAKYTEVQAHLPYYNAIIKESMRLCPSAPNIFPRMVSAGGLDLNGRFAPEGTEVTCNPHFVGRDPQLYGDDANEFRPERWIESSEEQIKDFNKYTMVFGYGARICLGKDIAMMEMAKGPLLFFQNFDIELVDKSKTGDFIVHGGIGFWENIHVTIKKRNVANKKI